MSAWVVLVLLWIGAAVRMLHRTMAGELVQCSIIAPFKPA
jgi:hypothetical protein